MGVQLDDGVQELKKLVAELSSKVIEVRASPTDHPPASPRPPSVYPRRRAV